MSNITVFVSPNILKRISLAKLLARYLLETNYLTETTLIILELVSEKVLANNESKQQGLELFSIVEKFLFKVANNKFNGDI